MEIWSGEKSGHASRSILIIAVPVASSRMTKLRDQVPARVLFLPDGTMHGPKHQIYSHSFCPSFSMEPASP